MPGPLPLQAGSIADFRQVLLQQLIQQPDVGVGHALKLPLGLLGVLGLILAQQALMASELLRQG
mgnify:CR=1 FL=1